MTTTEALEAASHLLKDEANQLAHLTLSSKWVELPHRAQQAINTEIERMRSAVNTLTMVEAELSRAAWELNEDRQQIENLGKFIGHDGMTTARIVSEAVSVIENLRIKAAK